MTVDKLQQLVEDLLPSIEITGIAPTSGQRSVFFARFHDAKIPPDVPEKTTFLRGWEGYGDVVVKVCQGVSATAVARLQFEAEVLAQCPGAGFPRQYYSDLITEHPLTEEPLGTTVFLTVEEFIPSVPLTQVVGNYSTEGTVADLLLQICGCLRVLWEHPRMLVHRDIKPDNILVRDDGRVVVIDLGILRETGASGLTLADSAVGPMTPRYAAPEQWVYDRTAISYKTDFFAMAVLAYELLSNVHPFLTEDDQFFADCALIVSKKPHVPLSHRNSLVSDEFSDLIDQMLEKKPYKRPRTPAILEKKLSEIRNAS